MASQSQFSWKSKKNIINLLSAELPFTTLLAKSADDKLLLFFLFFPENRILHFMQIVCIVFEETSWLIQQITY